MFSARITYIASGKYIELNANRILVMIVSRLDTLCVELEGKME